MRAAKVCQYVDGVCQKCGHVSDVRGLIRVCRPVEIDGTREADSSPPATPAFKNIFPAGLPGFRASLGLGDRVAAFLSAMGITKERVSSLAGGDCGCHKRQEALNELGRKIGIG